MVTLSEIQMRMRDALLSAEAKPLDDILGSTAGRFEIHRRHFAKSITAALEKTFPAVVSLVDARFFAFAADAFIRSKPPVSPCLSEYGAELPEFLAAFPACACLPYLPDVARLEWAIHTAYHAHDSAAGESALFHPSLRHLVSRFPVHRIWNVALGRAEGPVDLSSGPVRLMIYRAGDDVSVEVLTETEFRVHRALVECGDFALVAHATSELYPGFDIDATFGRLKARNVLAQSPAISEDAR